MPSSNRYFTSDLHFGHRAVIEYAKRPFASVDEMDAAMIARWNAAVKPDGIVFVVGDFSSHVGAWHLYGHSHGLLPDDPNALSLDVGVDCWGFRPVSFAQIQACMATKTWKPVDGHGGRA